MKYIHCTEQVNNCNEIAYCCDEAVKDYTSVLHTAVIKRITF